MQVKNEEFYRKLGFRYENEEDFNREFALAKAFFEMYPQENKIRRKAGGDFDWSRVLSILHQHRPDLVPDLDMALSSPPKHSYINQFSAENPSEKIVLALGSKLADGHCGRIKNSINEYGKHLVQKIETGIKGYTELDRKTKLNRNIGLLHGVQIIIKDGTYKHYTAFPYLGVDLLNRHKRQELSSFSGIIKVARKTAWGLYRLHCGDNKTNTPIAHCDIKPEHIMLADNGHVEIVDYGISKTLDMSIRLEGTAQYMPTDSPDSLKCKDNEILRKAKKETLNNMRTFGLLGTDIVAFKKTFSNFIVTTSNTHLLNSQVSEIFKVDVASMMDRREVDTALNITIALIEQEMNLTPMCLSDLNAKQKQLICSIFAKLDKLEELSFGNEDNRDVVEIANTFRFETVSSTKTETQLSMSLDMAEGLLRDYQEFHQRPLSVSHRGFGLFTRYQVNPLRDLRIIENLKSLDIKFDRIGAGENRDTEPKNP